MNIQTEVHSLDFEQVTVMRWLTGRARRMLGHLDPFEGDATREFSFKMGDGANLLHQMRQEGKVNEATEQRGLTMLNDLWTMSQTADQPTDTVVHEWVDVR